MSFSTPPHAPPAGEPLLSMDGARATLTLRRPAHRNRLHDEDLRALLAHFERINADPAVRVLVLRALPTPGMPVFCAGYHVGEFDAAPDAGERISFEQVPDALEQLRPLTVCALGGSVFGGATDLALACDLRAGVHGMRLRMPAAALGLHYYPSGLRRYLARTRAGFVRRAFLTAHTFEADELLAAGYLDALMDADVLDAWVDQVAAQACALAPLALQGMKQSLREIEREGLHPGLMPRIEARWRESQHSADFAEGRAAFAERRPPRFEGR